MKTVKSKLSESALSTIQLIISRYSVGDIESIVELTQGYANENILVITNQRKILYRICKQQPRDLLEYEVRLMKKLKDFDIKTAYPIQDTQGNYIQSMAQDHVMLYVFKEGQEPDVNTSTSSQMGKEIGRLSQLPLSTELEKKNAIHIDNCFQLITEFGCCKNPMPDIFKYFEEQTEYLNAELNKDLPKGIVHGDAFPNNTIFNDGKLKAIIDFEEACSDQLLFDVGMTINGFCFEKNKLKPELIVSFLEAYNLQRRMSDKEWLALPIYIQWGSHGMLSWHLRNKLINVKNSTQLTRVIELMERTLWAKEHSHDIMEMIAKIR